MSLFLFFFFFLLIPCYCSLWLCETADIVVISGCFRSNESNRHDSRSQSGDSFQAFSSLQFRRWRHFSSWTTSYYSNSSRKRVIWSGIGHRSSSFQMFLLFKVRVLLHLFASNLFFFLVHWWTFSFIRKVTPIDFVAFVDWEKKLANQRNDTNALVCPFAGTRPKWVHAITQSQIINKDSFVN